MAKATVEGGKGGRSLKPSFSSKLKKLAAATPGIIGASVLEGIGGPKAKAGGKVASFVARTGAKVIAERKGAAILAEKAARTGKISKIAARREAEKAAGRKAGRVGGNKALRGTAPKPDVRITTKTGTPAKDTVTRPVSRTLNKRSAVTVTKTKPKKVEDIISDRARAKRDRLRTVLTPIKPRGTKSNGKVMAGAKGNRNTFIVAKPGKATEANKVITAPRTRMGDPAKGDVPKQTESRRVALKNAGSDSRNASQPSNKTPAERELEQRPDTNRVSSPRAKDPAQREADRRVAEGLKAERKAKPNPPRKMAPRSPNYPKSTAARFKRQTGGTE
jgi:hypothetical protein